MSSGNEISSNEILEGDVIGFLDACKKSLDFQAPRKRNIPGQINREINFFVVDQNKKAYNEQ